MSEFGLSSLPLVDHANHLLGTISLTDIKYVFKGFKYNLLWNSCYQFISYVRNHQGLVEDMGMDRYPVFDVREKDSLSRAMGKMGATRAHRVWVVNDQNKLSGVVSLTDVLRALLPETKKE
jgi:CBS domain-containing protein